jgi:hypothetical protein
MRFLEKLFRGREASAAPTDDDAEDMVSLVVLSNTYVELTLDTVRQHLDSLYPGEFLPPRNEGSFVVDGAVEGATFMIKSAVPGASGIYMLHSVPGPYTEFSNFDEFITDPDLCALAQSQNCWLSVDLMMRGSAPEQEAYRFIGAVLAVLAPADSAALVHPTKPLTIRFDDDVRRHLAKGSIFADA